MSQWAELEKKYYMATFKRLPVVLVRGQGVRLWDDAGKEYLDFTAGWAVDCLGHCHPVHVSALTEQGRTLWHVSNQFYTVPQLQLAELLVKNSCLDRVFFCNSGAEANEGAVKLARKYGKLHLDGAYEVITALESFHGRTLAMVAATGQRKFQEPYTPMPIGFIHVPYNDIAALKQATTSHTCAVMLELVQGESGVQIPAVDYIKQVRAWCDERGILLILDEVQTGIGRLGALFGYQQFGVEPDIMTLAKGLGGGFPIGAFMCKEKAHAFSPGDHGSTFAGSPLACAVGYATMKFIIDHNLSEQARRTGVYLLERLKGLKSKYDFIVDARGWGLLAALEFNSDISAQVVNACLEKGLLLNPVKPNAIRFMPALIITEKEIDEGIGILDKVLAGIAPKPA